MEDRADLLRYANNRNIWRNLRDHFPHPYLSEHADAWLALAAGPETPEGIYAIEVDGTAVGVLGIERGKDIETSRDIPRLARDRSLPALRPDTGTVFRLSPAAQAGWFGTEPLPAVG
jgi:hypothetical protein